MRPLNLIRGEISPRRNQVMRFIGMMALGDQFQTQSRLMAQLYPCQSDRPGGSSVRYRRGRGRVAIIIIPI